MKFGTFVYEPEKAAGFDFHLLRVKVETGDRIPPVQDMYSNIAVFAFLLPWITPLILQSPYFTKFKTT